MRADAKGQLEVRSEGKATTLTVTPEQAEIARLKAQVARLTMERDIAGCRGVLCADAARYAWIFWMKALADHIDVRGSAGQRQRIFPLGCVEARYQARRAQAAQR